MTELVTRLQERGRDHLPGLLGLELTAASNEAIEARLPVTEQVMAPNGFLHAASVVGLLDTLCGYGTMANLPEGASGFTTIELKSNFLGTAREGVVLGRSTPVHRGRSTQVWDARAWRESDGQTIALFRCTQMVLWPKPA
ncbi:PaaI family thioesterase [Maricaulis sp. CAU 1757]